MDVSQAVMKRQAVRAFLPTPVDPGVVVELLELARWAPSGGNLQPWSVHAVTGRARDVLTADVLRALAEGRRDPRVYDVYPADLWEPYRARRSAAGSLRFSLLGMPKGAEAAAELERRNAEFFGAPVGLFISIDRHLGPPQWSDLGMFMATLMLLCVERGLATCPQEFWGNWNATVKRHCDISEERIVFAGMALGHADTASTMNAARPQRVGIDEFAKFLS